MPLTRVGEIPALAENLLPLRALFGAHGVGSRLAWAPGYPDDFT